jgi:LPXTG-site transpeptidase (sortase) family protein
MTKLRWWVTGIGAVTLLVVAAFLLSSEDVTRVGEARSVVSETLAGSLADEAEETRASSAETDSTGSAAAGNETGTGTDVSESVTNASEETTVASDGSGSSVVSVRSGSALSQGTTTSSAGTTVDPAVTTGSASGLRLRIPMLGVDAPISELGFDADGQLEVPNEAGSVGWYSISARPGESGNALLGGHLNWRGQRGVFDRLDELNDGDLIYLVQSGEEMVFQVSVSRSVGADASLREVLRAPAGVSTLTLFTCGGTFDRAAGEYDQRLVVNAVRVIDGAS